MQTIKQLMDKIKWDIREDPAMYTFYYKEGNADKIELIKFTFDEIQSITPFAITLHPDKEIPLHRIKMVERLTKVVWERTH